MLERTLQVINIDLLKKIQTQKILLVGIGGVGGAVLEGLVRTGFINITIVDHDIIEQSNLNRQIIANLDNIGKLKVEEAQKRYLTINPNLNLKIKKLLLNQDNIQDIYQEQYDFIIDACDTITTKYLLIKMAQEKHINIISCMGTGNRLDPSKVEITTLNKTYNDPLAKAMRKILKKNHLNFDIPVIWSREEPIKQKEVGSLIMVPTSASMLIIYYLIDKIKATF